MPRRSKGGRGGGGGGEEGETRCAKRDFLLSFSTECLARRLREKRELTVKLSPKSIDKFFAFAIIYFK